MSEETYTHGHHESVLRSHTWRTAANSAPNLLPLLAPGQSVLDVGCGPGTITADLARLVAPGRVVGVDRSPAVIDLAAGAGGVDGPSFRVGDVYRLDFDDDTFDVVHAHQVLQHLAQPVRALTEMRRVCRPDGVVAVRDGDYSSFAWAPLDARLDRWLELYRSLARHNGGEPDAGRFLLGWMQEAGFSEVRAGASVWRFSTPHDRAWWGGMWADRMRDSAIATQLVELGWSTVDELAEIEAAFRVWADHPAGWFAVPHGEAFGTP
ncbi:MAG: putative ubiquinone/menaquinone methyltransferase [Acidimicrobiales bacterium]|nr:putative ubiquinone/menaquinone methyltransferase [Acidimicrobiales bacterium]